MMSSPLAKGVLGGIAAYGVSRMLGGGHRKSHGLFGGGHHRSHGHGFACCSSAEVSHPGIVE